MTNSSNTKPFKTFPRSFYNRNPKSVAKDILGCYLVRKIDNEYLIGKITEVEVYLGSNDLAAHARAGKTKRTAVLYGPAGFAYIFKTRHHHCLNVVTEEENNPSCLLIRSIEPILGLETMKKNRVYNLENIKKLANGPAKLCQALLIDMTQYGQDLTKTTSDIFITKKTHETIKIERSKRIGITKNPDKLFRYTIKNSSFLSR